MLCAVLPFAAKREEISMRYWLVMLPEMAAGQERVQDASKQKYLSAKDNKSNKDGANSLKNMKERQLSKIREVGEALVASGFVSLDDQAKALGVSRSTAWVILRGRYKRTGLTPKIVERILKSQQLPPLVRLKIIEYGEEKAAGLYGQTTPQTYRFFCELASSGNECVRLAQLTDNPNIREQLPQMAREWMAAAMHEETLSEPKSPHHG
jgi:hypothetical protein